MKTKEEISRECTWCGLPLNETIHGIGSSYSGPLSNSDTFVSIPLTSSDRSLFGAVIRDGSRVYNEGYRLIFGSCSDTCADEIEKALKVEGDRFPKRMKLEPAE